VHIFFFLCHLASQLTSITFGTQQADFNLFCVAGKHPPNYSV